MTPVDYSHHVEEHTHRGVRLLYVCLGCLFVVIGIVGAFLPLLPTTPFMLLAAGCFARASKRFYNRLLNSRMFGPAILEWRMHRSIPHRIKLVAITTMAITLTISVLTVVRNPWLQALSAVLGCALALWMYRIPSRDAPAHRSGRDRT